MDAMPHPPSAISPVPRPDLVEQANEGDAGRALFGVDREGHQDQRPTTNDMAPGLDDDNALCLVSGGRRGTKG